MSALRKRRVDDENAVAQEMQATLDFSAAGDNEASSAVSEIGEKNPGSEQDDGSVAIVKKRRIVAKKVVKTESTETKAD